MYISGCSLKEVTLNDARFMFGANDLIKQKYSLLCAFKKKLLAKDSVLSSKPLFSEWRNIPPVWEINAGKRIEQNTWK